jgi:asparagine synthase (glutamine-hydrolysing)
MCGICGIAYSDNARIVDGETLARMTGTLTHRGPDSDGFHRAAGIGIGMRRLSIVDLETGDQPLANEDGSVIVVCNGEIYNHVELRQRLTAAGHRFRSTSDTEVIVHLYEDHGEAFVDHLRGMFAIALWDARRRRLVLARDRLGIKPLHYALRADGLVFGSEQKALLASGLVPPRPDLHALRQLLTYGRVIAPRTIVAGIHRLLPGHLLIWSGGRAQLKQYWDVRFPARDEYDRRPSADAWAEGLHTALTESVRLHLRSDVPVGGALSGGIDSSTIVALMAQASATPVKTFTLRFADAEADELRAQRGLDDFPQYRLQGDRSFCSRDDLAWLPKAIWHGEDMLAVGPLLGLMIVASRASAHVKVMLTGEGSDEIFGGYSWYRTLHVLGPLLALPRPLRAWLHRVGAIRRRWPGAAYLLAGDAKFDFERYSRSITHMPSQAGPARVLAPDVLAELARDGPIDDAPSIPPEFATWHPFAQLQYYDLKQRMADGVVQGLDRATMAYSVEARVPFLDHHVVEYAARIPPWVKMQRLTEKAVLRRAMARTLPPEIARRPKYAMNVPIGLWLRDALPPPLEASWSDRALVEAGYFCPENVRTLRERHRNGAENLGQLLSTVLGMQIWDQVFRHSSIDPLAGRCATS